MSLLFNMLSSLVIAFLPRNKCLGSVVKNPLAKAGDTGDMGSIPGLGRSPGEGNGNPLHDFCLENPIDREVWWATVHGVARVGHD